MTKRSSNRNTKPERPALAKPPTSNPKLSAKELGLWKYYFQDPSAPRLYTPPTSTTKEYVQHLELLENFKNYYISNQVEITEYDTIIYVLRTYSGMSVRSEYNIVDCLRLLDPKFSGFPEAIVALYHVKTPENDKPYVDRALSVMEPLKAVPKNSPAKEQQLGARFLSIAEDLEEEVSCRFYVPGGQNSGPLYGQYVQDDALSSIDVEQLDQGRGRYKSTAVVWRKWGPPLEDLGTEERKREPPLQKLTTEEWKRNNIALRHIVDERRLYVKYLLEYHESSAGMIHRGRG
ncbi:hypothetical protein BPAE_0088g00420 [Botrytis paeoniae]|uniref:Uncharacterized protein n=1 Tax=Botrytis paeoniae TaxID=278948 RepID=A0A4Z1FQ38_9HELO|nr:hypothetical protein BPAE_0088g00420 [Botrytis paeoniae]